MTQLRAYERTLAALSIGKPEFMRQVEDLDFSISWVIQRKLWCLPYATHLAIALAIALPTGMWALSAACSIEIMSGWMVNAFGHAMGGRNFEMDDSSTNNHVVAWLVFGEGFQNNHDCFATSAKFSYHWWELDFGYGLCVILEKLGFVDIRREYLIPSPSAGAIDSEVRTATVA